MDFKIDMRSLSNDGNEGERGEEGDHKWHESKMLEEKFFIQAADCDKVRNQNGTRLRKVPEKPFFFLHELTRTLLLIRNTLWDASGFVRLFYILSKNKIFSYFC